MPIVRETITYYERCRDIMCISDVSRRKFIFIALTVIDDTFPFTVCTTSQAALSLLVPINSDPKTNIPSFDFAGACLASILSSTFSILFRLIEQVVRNFQGSHTASHGGSLATPQLVIIL